MTPPPVVFLDTDVILDFLLRRTGFFVPAARILQAGMEGRLRLMVSAGSLKDVFYFARKAAGREILARESIRMLLQVVEVGKVDGSMWGEALASSLKDTEDALQVACAVGHGARFLITRNLKDFAGTQALQVLSPASLVAIMEPLPPP